MDADEYEGPAMCSVCEPATVLSKPTRWLSGLEIVFGMILVPIGVVLATIAHPRLEALLIGDLGEGVRVGVPDFAAVVAVYVCLTGFVLAGVGAMTRTQARDWRAAQFLAAAVLILTGWIAFTMHGA